MCNRIKIFQNTPLNARQRPMKNQQHIAHLFNDLKHAKHVTDHQCHLIAENRRFSFAPTD